MPNFKKSSGFKMNGYSYPGQSPMKGKKANQQAAAAERKVDATSAIEDFATLKGEATNLMEGTNVQYGEISSPVKENVTKMPTLGAEQLAVEQGRGMTTSTGGAENNYTAPKTKLSTGAKFKGAMGSDVGQAITSAVIEGAVKLGVNALMPKPKKQRRRVNPAAGFSQIKIGRS